MAELVDAPDLKSCFRLEVWVRFPLAPPLNMSEFNRDHDPNGNGGPSILIGIALLWLALSIALIIGGVIWWIMS